LIIQSIKNYSLTSSLNPTLRYLNADLDKSNNLKEIKGKGGIYRWINNTNGKSYVGSSVDLSKRLYRYYSLAHIIDRSKHSLICKALIKYGYSKFSFEILEFCDLKIILIREQYYIDLLKLEYNILLKAGSPLGYKHRDEAKEKMKGSKIFSLEHLTKIKEHIKNLNTKRAVIIEVFDTKKKFIPNMLQFV